MSTDVTTLPVLRDYDVPPLVLLDAEDLISRRGKAAKIFGKTSPETPIELKKKENQTLEFKSPLYVSQLHLITTKTGKSSKLRLCIILWDGREVEINDPSNDPESDITIFHIDDYMKGFKLENRNKGIGGTEELKGIKVYGQTIESLKTISTIYTDFMEDYEDLKKRVEGEAVQNNEDFERLKKEKEEFENYKDSLSERMKELEAEVNQKDDELKSVSTQLEEEEKSLGQVRADLQDTRNKEATAENNLQELKQKSTNLNGSISKLKTELQELQEKKDLYAENMENYIGESKKQVWFYYIMALIAVTGILCIAGYSITNLDGLIEELLVANKANANIGAWDFFIMRSPYATVCLTIIGALITLTVKLIDKVFEIQHQRIDSF